MFLLPIFAFLLSFLYFLSKKNKQSDLSFELPSDKPPAVVGHIVNTMNVVTLHELIATLVDLAYRKKIELNVIEKDKVVLKKKNLDKLLDFEKHAIDLVMQEKDEIVLEDEVQRIKSTKKDLLDFNQRFESWKESVQRYCESYHSGPHIETSELWEDLIMLLQGLGLAILFYVGIFLFYNYPLQTFAIDLQTSIIITIIVLLFYHLAIGFNDLTEEARKEKKKWLRLRATIDKYTWIKQKPPTEHVIWDRIMVYAIVLNSADAVYTIAKEFLELKKLQEYLEVLKGFEQIKQLPIKAVTVPVKAAINAVKIKT